MRINIDPIKKRLKRTHKHLKHNLNRKRTRRKIIGVVALLLLVGLGSGLLVRDVQAVRRARVIKQKHMELLDAKQNLERLDKQKANTEYELMLKSESEKFLKQQVEQLNKDLQTKRAKQTQLANARPAPKPKAAMAVKKQATAKPRAVATVRPLGRIALGNTYTPGQCTWHVKNMRGNSLPNGLGNANQWAARARAMGMATGSAPRVGAAGMRKTGNHVVYVLQVRGSEVLISEMNYNWTPYAKRTIWKPASLYIYIY